MTDFDPINLLQPVDLLLKNHFLLALELHRFDKSNTDLVDALLQPVMIMLVFRSLFLRLIYEVLHRLQVHIRRLFEWCQQLDDDWLYLLPLHVIQFSLVVSLTQLPESGLEFFHLLSKGSQLLLRRIDLLFDIINFWLGLVLLGLQLVEQIVQLE